MVLFILGGSRKPNTPVSCVLWLSVLTHCSGVASLSAANIASLKIFWERGIPPEFIQGHRMEKQGWGGIHSDCASLNCT